MAGHLKGPRGPCSFPAYDTRVRRASDTNSKAWGPDLCWGPRLHLGRCSKEHREPAAVGLGVLVSPELMGYGDVHSPTPVHRCQGQGWVPLQLCQWRQHQCGQTPPTCWMLGEASIPLQTLDLIRLPPQPCISFPICPSGRLGLGVQDPCRLTHGEKPGRRLDSQVKGRWH